ncbi:MAG: hypothetical protein JWR16_404 [Nevskia sp.]|nr:hypothetical protein [Nevskia sp.]
MHRSSVVLLVTVGALVNSACSLVAPQYTADLSDVQRLKDAHIDSAKVGEFTASKESTISLRGSSLSSPYENSYGKYLAESLKQELQLAGKLAPDSTIEVTGVLLENDLDASGFSTGTGHIKAHFTVKHSDATAYDQIKAADIKWDSSFVGSVAIPRAQQQYPKLVQALLSKLFDDKAFIKALQQASQP